MQLHSEAISLLSPFFERLPSAYKSLIVVICGDYRKAAQQAGIERDRELLGPVVVILNRLDEDSSTGSAD